MEMKKNKLIASLGVLAIAASLSSCINEQGFELQSGGVSLTFSADMEKAADTKATLDNSYAMVWENNDQLGLFIDNAQTPTVNKVGTASVDNSSVTYSAVVNDYAAGDRLYAYYPYASGAERTGSKVRLSIEPKQTQTKVGVLNGKNFPMVSAPYAFVSGSSEKEEPSLYFKHLAAFIEFDIFAAEEAFKGEMIQSVELRTASTIAGAFQFDYTGAADNQDFSITANGSSTSVTVTLDTPAEVTDAKGINKVYMALKPGKYPGSIRVTTDRGVYLFQVPEQLCTFERAYVRRFALGLREEKQVFKSTLDEYNIKYIGTQTHTSKGVYFDLETGSNYTKDGAVSSDDRKKTDLVLFRSSNGQFCLAAPACTDLSAFQSGGVIDCSGWTKEEKNKTKIQLLADFSDDQYSSLTPADIESITEDWESKSDASYHRQNGVAKGAYYGFKTVKMDASGNVAEVVSAGVMKITGLDNSSASSRCIKFDYKITQSSSVLDVPSVVSVSGRKLLVEGDEFVVKGVAGNSFTNNPATVGANTVRLYNMTTTTLGTLGYALDEAWMNGLKVCVGIFMFPWNQNDVSDFYNTNYEGSVAKVRTHVKNVVETYRNHPAVLMWCLGNECESAYDGSENLEYEHHMWNVINEFATYVKEMDPNHPVTTCLANAVNVSYVTQYCPNLDLLMVNSYGSAITNLSSHLSAWTKPFVVGEFGPAGTWQMHETGAELPWTTSAEVKALVEQTSTQKAKDYVTAWNNVITVGAAGGFAFHWGYQTHGEVLTWFGMHDKKGNSFGVVDEMQKLWTGSYPSVMAPVIEDRTKMKMNGKVADDKISVSPSSSCTAAVDASSPSGSTLSYEWIVVGENTAASDGSLPEGISGLITNPSNASVTFTAPSEPGAYRLYVFVYDNGAGKVASACVPFQVTE